ncbi:aspartate/glutamate racemase family protein [Paraburkholderia sp. PGU16]|jgi:allantoin racemase|uniref:Asp/Glu/hydantoin racemase n=1 Tax=Paraburkholderia largidicola TaxID=3014751 RepID=A0A7I8C201_9BURK|nr:aspartate/glutamate racemase family protein [Paraburkholderia sp. PGU16]BCF94521.1 Asp/Glu/hydantoin racemase [Paraburkholderia sp. PGU16]BEU27803.1 aspartate/glutamate racemase family protein [Paraburkholderia sp. 22B1P]
MKILVINPNISESVSTLIQAEAQRSASPGTEIAVATAPFGVAYIETRFEALVGAYATACVAAEHHGTYDGVVVAAFGDPGLQGIKELIDVPVVGLTESSLMTAATLGQRFSIIAISPRIKAWYRETVERSRLASRLASIRALDEPLRDIGSVQQDYASRLKALCNQVVDDDGADVIIIAGAPLAGLAREIRDELPVPVVDGVSSAITQLEGLIRLGPKKAAKGSFAQPPVKPNRGLPGPLERLLSGGQTD